MQRPEEAESLHDVQKAKVDIIMEEECDDQFGYDVEDTPPLAVTLTTAFQHSFMCVRSVVTNMTVLAATVCADINDPVRSVLFSSSVLLIGLSTAAQSYLGLRLPVFQGASSSFLIPLLALKESDSWSCPSDITANSSRNMTFESPTIKTPDIVYHRLAEIQGSLVAASVFEVLIGLTGLIGILMRFISPIVIGVTVFCLGYSMYPVAIILCRSHWGIGLAGAVLMVLLSVYMAHIKVPLPRCTKTAGKKRNMFPVFQVFPVMITLAVMWAACAVSTKFNVFSDDPRHPSYAARTDVRKGLIRDTPWILMPYPGQFGWPGFNSALFIGFFIAVITSIIESVGDYIGTSHICKAYPVPRHAINRGIAIEGIFSVLSGFYGVGHATTSYSTTISLLGITKIRSRIVLVVSGLIAVIFGVFGKFGAFMTSVPAPALGGIVLAMVGLLCSVGISAFKSIELRSSRNMSVIGISIFVAIVMAEWQRQYPDSLRTDSEQLNQAVKVTVGNAMFIGFILSLILDNTVRGSDTERGVNKDPLSHDDYVTSRNHLYDLPMIGRFQQRCKLLRHMPFLQSYSRTYDVTEDKRCNILRHMPFLQPCSRTYDVTEDNK